MTQKTFDITLTIADKDLTKLKDIFSEKKFNELTREDLEHVHKAFSSLQIKNDTKQTNDEKIITNGLNLLNQDSYFAPTDQRSLTEYVRDYILDYDNDDEETIDDPYEFVYNVFENDNYNGCINVYNIDNDRDIYAFRNDFIVTLDNDDSELISHVDPFEQSGRYFFIQVYAFAERLLSLIFKDIPKNEDGLITVNALKHYLENDLDVYDINNIIYR